MGELITREQGYLTVAYGREEFLQQAVSLACSVKRFDFTRGLSIITDARLASKAKLYQQKDIFDDVIVLADDALTGFKGKLIGSEVSPYARTIYIDSDCLLVQNVDKLWQYMESQDFCVQGEIVYDGTYSGSDVKLWCGQLGISYLPIFNGGCFSWNEGGKRVLRRAVQILDHAENYSLPKGTYGFDDDQPAIGIAMAELDIRLSQIR